MASIPKIIHYCWVGGNPKPQSVLYCIESWKRFCPDYEIREWNESNYDFTKNEYMHQALEAKKWGFVPDYARLDIVYEYGGIYLDTDVELVASLDSLLQNACFFGFENTGDGEFFVNCGHGFGAVPHHDAIKKARDHYDRAVFRNVDGTLNLLPSPHYTTQILRGFGLVQENRDQHLSGIQVFASDVLCPKNFRTGRLTKTARTVSIHHFSASWVDEKIKAEMEHQKRIIGRFGKRFGKYILYMESVMQKYSLTELITKLPGRVFERIKKRVIVYHEAVPFYAGILQARIHRIKNKKTVLLDTSLDSDNRGDEIIVENCLRQLSDYLESEKLTRIPTHRFLHSEEIELLRQNGRKIVCGTNLLSGYMRSYGLWKLGPEVAPYCGAVLMGVGFDSKDESFDHYTKLLLNTILSSDHIHSVRDSFSEKKLKQMGIKNVVNTACPTMWGLTTDRCMRIPSIKANRVVCTLTDYCRDENNDRMMLDILLNCYQKVYFWLQGKEDLNYIQELGYVDRVQLISSTLEAYDRVLAEKDLDYVGTRLHAGIRALSAGHRSLIIAIDNRAECIGADTGLPIMKREDIAILLKEKLMGTIKTEITLPWENIERWKNQFR